MVKQVLSLKPVTGLINSETEKKKLEEWKKKRILMQIGELLFRQGLIDIEEKKKFDRNIN